MKRISILFLLTILSLNIAGQTNKGNWMVGGSAKFSFINQTLLDIESDGFHFQIAPSGGYFFADKIAGGIRASVDFDRAEFLGGVSKSTQLGIGPFIRYYVLNKENRVNLLAETSYKYFRYSGTNATSSDASSFIISAGPVIYFNTSVGLEFTLNYDFFNYNDADRKARTFYFGIGFQVHLEKETN